jgi:hypothetical protein
MLFFLKFQFHFLFLLLSMCGLVGAPSLAHLYNAGWFIGLAYDFPILYLKSSQVVLSLKGLFNSRKISVDESCR